MVSGPPKWLIKLADFGLSKRLTESSGYHTQAGTEPYMAPEILPYLDTNSSGGEYTNAVDLWAVGCIAYRIITGVVPFRPAALVDYCRDSSQFPSDLLYGNGVRNGSSYSNFVQQLLATDPKARPSALQALNHAWIISGRSRRMSILNSEVQRLIGFVQAPFLRDAQEIFQIERAPTCQFLHLL